MKNDYKKTSFLLTEKIKTRLKEKKIRKQELAKMIGVVPAQVSRWFTGDCNFTLKTLVMLDKILGIGLEQWVTSGTLKINHEGEGNGHHVSIAEPDNTKIIITIDIEKHAIP